MKKANKNVSVWVGELIIKYLMLEKENIRKEYVSTKYFLVLRNESLQHKVHKTVFNKIINFEIILPLHIINNLETNMYKISQNNWN